MKIYELQYKNDVIDSVHITTMLVTNHQHEICNKVMKELENEEFTIVGFSSRNSMTLYLWENGISQEMWEFTPANKSDSMDFLEAFFLDTFLTL